VSSDVWHLDEPERFRGFRTITATTAFARGEGLPGRVLENGQPFWIVNLVEDENFTRAKLSSEIGLKPAFAFPVPVRGEVAAVIEFFSTEPQEVDEDLLMKMSQVGDQIGPVTERNRAFEKLADAMKKTELAKRAKTDFLANMSHELRTPLNSIIGFSEVMSREEIGKMPDHYREYADLIHQSGSHLHGIIGDILDLTKIEAVKVELKEEPVDVNKLIEEILTMLSDVAAKNNVTISRKGQQADLPELCCDQMRIKQVVLNLLGNSIKFSESGIVTVLGLMSDEGGFQIRVSDTGIGIPPDELDHITDSFYQAGVTPEHTKSGTGLGLTITKKIVKMHGGRMDIASTVGEGTTVTVHFPPARTRHSFGT